MIDRSKRWTQVVGEKITFDYIDIENIFMILCLNVFSLFRRLNLEMEHFPKYSKERIKEEDGVDKLILQAASKELFFSISSWCLSFHPFRYLYKCLFWESYVNKEIYHIAWQCCYFGWELSPQHHPHLLGRLVLRLPFLFSSLCLSEELLRLLFLCCNKWLFLYDLWISHGFLTKQCEYKPCSSLEFQFWFLRILLLHCPLLPRKYLLLLLILCILTSCSWLICDLIGELSLQHHHQPYASDDLVSLLDRLVPRLLSPFVSLCLYREVLRHLFWYSSKWFFLYDSRTLYVSLTIRSKKKTYSNSEIQFILLCLGLCPGSLLLFKYSLLVVFFSSGILQGFFRLLSPSSRLCLCRDLHRHPSLYSKKWLLLYDLWIFYGTLIIRCMYKLLSGLETQSLLLRIGSVYCFQVLLKYVLYSTFLLVHICLNYFLRLHLLPSFIQFFRRYLVMSSFCLLIPSKNLCYYGCSTISSSFEVSLASFITYGSKYDPVDLYVKNWLYTKYSRKDILESDSRSKNKTFSILEIHFLLFCTGLSLCFHLLFKYFLLLVLFSSGTMQCFLRLLSLFLRLNLRRELHCHPFLYSKKWLIQYDLWIFYVTLITRHMYKFLSGLETQSLLFRIGLIYCSLFLLRYFLYSVFYSDHICLYYLLRPHLLPSLLEFLSKKLSDYGCWITSSFLGVSLPSFTTHSFQHDTVDLYLKNWLYTWWLASLVRCWYGGWYSSKKGRLLLLIFRQICETSIWKGNMVGKLKGMGDKAGKVKGMGEYWESFGMWTSNRFGMDSLCKRELEYVGWENINHGTELGEGRFSRRNIKKENRSRFEKIGYYKIGLKISEDSSEIDDVVVFGRIGRNMNIETNRKNERERYEKCRGKNMEGGKRLKCNIKEFKENRKKNSAEELDRNNYYNWQCRRIVMKYRDQSSRKKLKCSNFAIFWHTRKRKIEIVRGIASGSLLLGKLQLVSKKERLIVKEYKYTCVLKREKEYHYSNDVEAGWRSRRSYKIKINRENRCSEEIPRNYHKTELKISEVCRVRAKTVVSKRTNRYDHVEFISKQGKDGHKELRRANIKKGIELYSSQKGKTTDPIKHSENSEVKISRIMWEFLLRIVDWSKESWIFCFRNRKDNLQCRRKDMTYRELINSISYIPPRWRRMEEKSVSNDTIVHIANVLNVRAIVCVVKVKGKYIDD